VPLRLQPSTRGIDGDVATKMNFKFRLQKVDQSAELLPELSSLQLNTENKKINSISVFGSG
jgi:hypothetical protein